MGKQSQIIIFRVVSGRPDLNALLPDTESAWDQVADFARGTWRSRSRLVEVLDTVFLLPKTEKNAD